MSYRRLLLILSVFAFMHSRAADQWGGAKDTIELKYIFYFIGDGMGFAQTQVADQFLKETRNDSISFMYYPYQGFIATQSQNHSITCSAAAGTAMASGLKTCNYAIGLHCNHTDTIYSLAKATQEKGMKVGIITSVTIDHATPAVFFAHNESRYNYYDIGLQLPASGINYFAGGGYKYPNGNPKLNTIVKQENLYNNDKKYGYVHAYNKDELKSLPDTLSKIHVTNNAVLNYTIDKTNNDFTLSDFLQKAISVLDNDNGFFIMLEGGKIDWACHNNDVATTIHEVIEFDEAIQNAFEFYHRHPNETLIIVTADHETGGLGLGYTGTGYTLQLPLLANQKISAHLFAEKVFDWTKENVSFHTVLDSVKYYFGFDKDSLSILTEFDLRRLKDAYSATINIPDDFIPIQGSEHDLKYGEYEPISVTAARILGEKAGISWTTYLHTGVVVPVRAIGVGAEHFANNFDNTDIAKKIFTLLGIQNPNDK